MSIWISIAVVASMFVGVALIPFGLPGLWLIVALTLGLVVVGELPWALALGVGGLAVLAELTEFLVVARFGRAFGGSRRAFWGAVLGGTVGLFVGFPIPLIGPIVTVFLGTFVGAGLVTYTETRSIGRSARVGWGVVLARTVAVGVKVGVALAVIAMVGVGLIF